MQCRGSERKVVEMATDKDVREPMKEFGEGRKDR